MAFRPTTCAARSLVVLLWFIVGCGPMDDPRRMTCAAWLAAPGEQRLALADRLVGDAGEFVEQIRVIQHLPPGTPRDTVVRDVEGSLTKSCQAWPPRARTVGEVLDALYR